MWTVVPDIYTVNTVPHILASIFNCAYLRWYWSCVDNWMRLILQTLCQIQRISSILRYVNCGPGHIQCSKSSNIQGSIFKKRSSAAIGLMSTIQRAFYCNVGANTEHILQFTLRELWSRTYTMHFQLRIFSAPIFNWTYLRSNWR
jgi:hypothetical protein